MTLENTLGLHCQGCHVTLWVATNDNREKAFKKKDEAREILTRLREEGKEEVIEDLYSMERMVWRPLYRNEDTDPPG
jgi:hypothetical protein